MKAKLARVLERIDQLHAEDPARVSVDGALRPAELVRAERMSLWLHRLVRTPSDALVVAVRAQHLARFRLPRTSYPEGKVGYLTWRRDASRQHAELCEEAMRAEDVDDATIARTKDLIRKKGLSTDAETQALEDASCLVFLAFELDAFAAKHDEEKLIPILQKTWAKMSDAAREHALALPFEPALGALVTKALADV